MTNELAHFSFFLFSSNNKFFLMEKYILLWDCSFSFLYIFTFFRGVTSSEKMFWGTKVRFPCFALTLLELQLEIELCLVGLLNTSIQQSFLISETGRVYSTIIRGRGSLYFSLRADAQTSITSSTWFLCPNSQDYR